MRLSVSPTPSNTPSNTPSVTPSNTSCPIITPTATTTLTPTPTTSTPVIYINLCVPQVVPADGRIPICIYSQTTSDCNGTRTNVSELTSLVGDLYIILEGESLGICGGILGTISAGTSCDCTSYCDAGAELSGFTVSATTSNLFPFTLPSNYVLGSICYDNCVSCVTPTPTPTLTPTLSVTPTTTPCPCVCGASIENQSETSITYQYTNCFDVVFSGTILPSATLVLPCGDSSIYVKWNSITTSGPATIIYGSCGEPPSVSPTPTPTVTPTIESGDFLLQEDSFLILQENGFAILLDVPLPTQTPTLTSTPTLTATPTLTPTTSSVPCDAADYLLFNETGGSLSWTALDCNGNGVGNTIPAGQQANTGCVQVGTLSEGSLTIVSSTPC